MVGAGERDRDRTGRAQSARPRDRLGRPLPRGSPNEHDARPLPDDPLELLRIGVEHFDAQQFFDAHEAWETAWHPSPATEREFWQGITQIAVGFTHFQRNNLVGAVTLLRRGAARLQGYPPEFLRFPVARLAADAHNAADTIERDGPHAQITFPTIAADRQEAASAGSDERER